VGRQVSNWLRGNEVRFVVAEQKRALVELLREQEIPAVLGDACEPATLIQAHIHKASLLIITQPDSLKTKQMIDIAKTLNPNVETLLIAANPAEAELMMEDQLGEVFVSEWEMAKNMADHALKRFGKSVDIKNHD
jgi:CPA2 family monovalent cation:H+ antiporter-2